MSEEIRETTSKGTRLKGVNAGAVCAILILITVIVSILLLLAVRDTNLVYKDLEEASVNYVACEHAANQMKEGSNYLTLQVRRFAATQNLEYASRYFQEANVTKRRENAVETLESMSGGESVYLKQSLAYSNELMGLEYYIMKLVFEAEGYEYEGDFAIVETVALAEVDAALSPQEKVERATELAYGQEYMDYVDLIEGNVTKCKESLISSIEGVQSTSAERLELLLFQQQLITALLLISTLAGILSIVMLVLRPVRSYTVSINEGSSLSATGARELRYLAGAYNEMYDENLKSHDTLRRKAEHDHLTGLYNRGVFERLLEIYSNEPYALLLIDVDYFKSVNDSLGHDGGDAVLKKISELLGNAFRTTDYPCRIGGDEFAVIMTEVDESLAHVVEAKVKGVVEGLADTSDGLPVITLSVGAAFNDGTLSGETVFKNADQALYVVKEAGRNGFRFYE